MYLDKTKQIGMIHILRGLYIKLYANAKATNNPPVIICSKAIWWN